MVMDRHQRARIFTSLRATGWRPSVADWCNGMSACCTAVQLFASARRFRPLKSAPDLKDSNFEND